MCIVCIDDVSGGTMANKRERYLLLGTMIGNIVWRSFVPPVGKALISADFLQFSGHEGDGRIC